MAESFRLFDGEKKLLLQLLVAFVRGQVQTIETGVASGQPRVFPHFLDAELLRPVTPHELSEASER